MVATRRCRRFPGGRLSFVTGGTTVQIVAYGNKTEALLSSEKAYEVFTVICLLNTSLGEDDFPKCLGACAENWVEYTLSWLIFLGEAYETTN